jgi:hypothetical protein
VTGQYGDFEPGEDDTTLEGTHTGYEDEQQEETVLIELHQAEKVPEAYVVLKTPDGRYVPMVVDLRDYPAEWTRKDGDRHYILRGDWIGVAFATEAEARACLPKGDE